MTAPISKRATAVLALMREPDRPFPYGRVTGAHFKVDDEWFRLGLLPNIAQKTIGELLEARAIEPGLNAGTWTLYRLAGSDEWLRQDYGDLWVPGPNGAAD
jgi:hypothetical protein